MKKKPQMTQSISIFFGTKKTAPPKHIALILNPNLARLWYQPKSPTEKKESERSD